VSHLVDDDILEALAGFLGEFQIQPDSAGLRIASTPLSFHAPDSPFHDLNVEDRLPFGEKRRDQTP
jgi:hypothetical protein